MWCVTSGLEDVIRPRDVVLIPDNKYLVNRHAGWHIQSSVLAGLQGVLYNYFRMINVRYWYVLVLDKYVLILGKYESLYSPYSVLF